MARKKDTPDKERYYFVDEAGDLTLFNRRKKLIIGRAGVSRTFMLGTAWIAEKDRAELWSAIESLRAQLLADPFLENVPSMRPDARKTAIAFHAKDDCPEVRHEVFKLLRATDVKVIVAIRRKATLAETRPWRFRIGGKSVDIKPPSPNEIYDDLVKRVFKTVLYQAELSRVVFAARGTRARTEALAQALLRAKINFQSSYGPRRKNSTFLRTTEPSDSVGLQVIDYFLWALQRLFERGEDRYFAPLREHYRLIMDLDDKRNKRYGEWYSDSNPLEVGKMKPL